MIIKFKYLIIFLFLLSLLPISGSFASKNKVLAQNVDQQRIEKLSKEISQYEQQLQQLKSQASTLSNQIAQFDAQIKLTGLKIDQTEEKILLLGGRIGQLQTSLQSLSKAFVSRVVYSYKISRLHEPLLMLVTSPNLTSAFSNYQYLKRIEESDRELLVRLQDAQVTYQEQKQVQEDLQKQLEDQKKVLGAQKLAKNNLLLQTKNDEKKYQALLASAKAEFEAIQAIISGKGQETSVGHINQGDKIASIIEGPSCNSSGEHLHFIVSQGSAVQNPFGYLKPSVSFENCSGSSCGSSDGDAFNPSGNWDWPISAVIKFYQGFGSTWATRNTWVGRIYNFHNGIDIKSTSNLEVHSVKSGTLFRGSYSGISGCRLRYVRVDHDDSDLNTYYLHINY